MKIRNFFVGAVAALAFIVGCQEKEQNLGTPEISISESEMTFEAVGGDQWFHLALEPLRLTRRQ